MAEQQQEVESSKSERPRKHGLLWLILGIVFVALVLLVIFAGWLPRHDRQKKIGEQAKQEQDQKPRPIVYTIHRAPTCFKCKRS